jgi:hypothetical protein
MFTCVLGIIILLSSVTSTHWDARVMSAMPENLHGVNTITIENEALLLAGGGDATHLVAECQDQDMARPAVEPWQWEVAEGWQASYDRSELESPRWSQRTLCGRDWSRMESADGPGFSPWSEPVYAPNCRSCLRIVSNRLESCPPDDRIPLVASVVLQEVMEHGHSRVDGVPGDQAEALRVAIRGEMRRHQLRGRTYLLGETVFVESDDAYDALPENRKDEIQQQLMDALDHWFDPTGDNDPPLTRVIRWDTWRVP